MDNTPEGLFAAVAKNILAKKKGQKGLATFQKEAASLEDYAKMEQDAFGDPQEVTIRPKGHPFKAALEGGAWGSGIGGILGVTASPEGDTFKQFGKRVGIGAIIGGLGLGAISAMGSKLQNKPYTVHRYTPEQETAQDELYNHENNIIDQIGHEILTTGKYTGPNFPNLLDPYDFNEEEVDLIKRYPRLIDAMKQDSRRDRGGILFNFYDNLDAYKNDPETQALIYKALEKQLDDNQFGGWKGQWQPEELRSYLGQPTPGASLAKQAADISGTPEQQGAMQNFLQQYQFSPGDFVGDPAADRLVSPIQHNTQNQIRGYFNSQAQLMGGMTKELKKNQQLAMRQLGEQSGQARVRSSILNTLGAASQDPGQFGHMVDLSNRSRAAFKDSKTADLATAGGGLAGLAGGVALGRSPVAKVGLGALGALGGGLAGLTGGRAMEEKKTGYNHGDVLKPYEVADRMGRRHKTDAKVN